MDYDGLIIDVLGLILVVFVMASLRQLQREVASIDFSKDLPELNIDLSQIKEEVLDIIEDTIGQMQPPNAMDHVFGALAQIIQMKAMKGMKEHLPTLLPSEHEDL